jgi:HSP20 family protein
LANSLYYKELAICRELGTDLAYILVNQTFPAYSRRETKGSDASYEGRNSFQMIWRFIMRTVSLYRPMSIEKAMNDLNRYMESFFDSPPALSNSVPTVDVQETDNAYLLEAELPGIAEKDIQVHVDNGILSIESCKEEESEKESRIPQEPKKEGSYLIRERRRMNFSRSFKLPENADTENVAAVFKNGILSLEIKKRAEAPTRKLIKIEAQ